MTTYTQTLAVGQKRYYVSLAVFLSSLALLLFTVVEIRRAFLFPLSSYAKIGSPSAILYLVPLHIPLLVLAALGVWLGQRSMTQIEVWLKGSSVDLKGLANYVAVAIMLLLIVDLFTYRGVPASRIAAAGKMGVGQAIPPGAFHGWLKPLGEGINYMVLVWHATILGILIGALFLTLVAGFLKPLLGRRGFKAHLAGAALAVHQPFCSCCAAPIGASLYQGGASLGPTLAFVVSSPMLNPTTLILATVLLPGDFAALRILGGLAVGVSLTYAVSIVASRWVGEGLGDFKPNRWVEISARLARSYSRLFRFGEPLNEGISDSPGALITTWLGLAWRLAKVVVPVLFLGSVVTAAIVMVLPSPGSGLPGILTASAFGTMLMIPTWTEIPIAMGLIKQGLSGPAAALLLTLPPVSIPCLLIIGGAMRNLRVAFVLGLLVFLVGVGAGAAFL